MSKAKAKMKSSRSSKQSKQQLTKLMRDLSKAKVSASSSAPGTCTRLIYCIA